MNKLSAHVKQMHEQFGRFCIAWYFDGHMPQNVIFRVYRDKTTSDLNGRTFQLKYDYVNVSMDESGGSSQSLMTTASSLPTGRANGQSQETQSQACMENSTDVLVLAIVCVVLVGSNIVTLFFLWRKHQSIEEQSGSQQPEPLTTSHQGHFNESSYASILDQAATCASVPSRGFSDHLHSDMIPYASVEEKLPSNQVMYDVPTNNRLRTPTVHSSHSVVAESDYQAPCFLTKVEEEIQQESVQSGKVKDVYAIVNKKKKTSLQE